MGIELLNQTIARLRPMLRSGELAACEAMACVALRELPTTPFHIAAELAISNDPAEAAVYFDDFHRTESERIVVRAVYTEMNGFDINPDRWYCDLFAYTTDGGLDDLDWLCDWQSAPAEDYTLIGLERLQTIYASDALHDPSHEAARHLASLVVVTKFLRFMQHAATRMKVLRGPLYITAHEFDEIARVVV